MLKVQHQLKAKGIYKVHNIVNINIQNNIFL